MTQSGKDSKDGRDESSHLTAADVLYFSAVRELKSVTLTCKHWREASVALLWRNASVSLSTQREYKQFVRAPSDTFQRYLGHLAVDISHRASWHWPRFRTKR